MTTEINPVGINESWSGFPWKKYPGGVCVSIAFVHGRALLLTRQSRWNITFPAGYLQVGQVLADVVSSKIKELIDSGMQISMTSIAPEISARHGEGRTYHVLVMVSCRQYGPIGAFERVDDALLLSGLASDSVMASCAAHVLNWSDANRHLPLPEGVCLVGETKLSGTKAVPAEVAKPKRQRPSRAKVKTQVAVMAVQ